MFTFAVVNRELEILKGIHPGFVLERKLKEYGLKKSPFALSIGEYPQTLTAITKGKRDIPISLALKIEEALALEEGYFAILQMYYNIRREKRKKGDAKPDMSKFRRILFWDTDINRIDWQSQARAVIQRVFERGNDQEKRAITDYYGRNKINALIRKPPSA